MNKTVGLFIAIKCWTGKNIFIYIYIVVVVVEGDQKAPFSIATTPRCRVGRKSFL